MPEVRAWVEKVTRKCGLIEYGKLSELKGTANDSNESVTKPAKEKAMGG